MIAVRNQRIAEFQLHWSTFEKLFEGDKTSTTNYRYVQYGYHAYLKLLYGQTTTQLPATFLMSAT